MIRISEAVLPGHPDKFCDLIADAIVREATSLDRDAYAQVEVAVWSDQMWLSGRVASSTPFRRSIEEIVRSTGTAIGLDASNWIDASRYDITSKICFETCDPTRWTHQVNDQSIAIGWAGYDALVDYLPPEHFLALRLRDALFRACRAGRLRDQGPDGKVLVRLRERGGAFELEHVLVSLQHREYANFVAFVGDVVDVLSQAYEALQMTDARWSVRFSDVEVLVNPNGPFVEAGSDGDNGQTGRKLVADHYGPRIPIGGGALSGKHWTHIDRLAAVAARGAAVEAVASGARICQIQLAYAPGIDAPLDFTVTMTGKGALPMRANFSHCAMRSRLSPQVVYGPLKGEAASKARIAPALMNYQSRGETDGEPHENN
jgi:S-adenosylmethionine synthetase